MAYQGIIFDKDGTLIDFSPTWLPVYRYAALELTNNDVQLAQQLLSCHGYDQATNRFIGGSLLAAGTNHDIAKAWGEHFPGVNDEAKLESLSARLNQIFQQQGALSSTPVRGLQATLRSDRL